MLKLLIMIREIMADVVTNNDSGYVGKNSNEIH